MRGATLTAIFKDILVWITVIAVIIAVPISIGGFGNAFKASKDNYVTLPDNLVPAYATLILGSALALYLYPHAITGVLSAQSVQKLRSSTALLPLYGVGLAILALMGILVYAVPGLCTFCQDFLKVRVVY